MDFAQFPSLTFEKPDYETFRNLSFAFEALKVGGNMACIINAANEIAVAAFLRDEIGFLAMSDLIENCMKKVSFVRIPTLEDYIETDKETRHLALEFV
jgi:1-deoxy-D-xylulose-5-phosphate reductoisomerase